MGFTYCIKHFHIKVYNIKVYNICSMKRKYKLYSFRLPAGLMKEFKNKVALEYKNMSTVIRELIKDYVEKKKGGENKNKE